MQAPCKDCPDRVLGCHSTCEKYIEFDKYRKELSRKKMEAHKQYRDIVVARRNRYKRRW